MPDARPRAIPYLIARDAAKAIAFYEKAFGAVQTLRPPRSRAAASATPSSPSAAPRSCSPTSTPTRAGVGPQTLGGTSVSVLGARRRRGRLRDEGRRRRRDPRASPVKTEFYGERVAWMKDPFGHRWFVATPIENVTTAEVQKRVGDGFKIE